MSITIPIVENVNTGGTIRVLAKVLLRMEDLTTADHVITDADAIAGEVVFISETEFTGTLPGSPAAGILREYG